MRGRIRQFPALIVAVAGLSAFCAAADAQTVSLQIPAASLGAALTEVARLTGRGVLFTPDTVEGLKAPAIQGNLTAEQAVSQLIAQTPLEVVADTAGNLVVRRPPKAKPVVPAVTLHEALEPVEIVRVVATRESADALQFKAIAPVSALSTADLEHTAVHNAAEALQLLPGINVTNTGNSFFGGIDGASRGEGMFAQVRGMNSEYTLNMINGVDVAQGMPYSREVQLSLLPPFGLQTIVVSKTAQADMQSDFIGGAVDFRTPTAFDFAGDHSFSMTLGGRLETRAVDYGENGIGSVASAEASQKFGAESQFGIYVSGYYDIRQFANSEMGALMELTGDKAWAFAAGDRAGKNPAGYNAERNLQSTGFNVGISSGYTARYGTSASLVWNASAVTSFYTRVTYAYAHTEQNSTLSQILGADITTGVNGIITSDGFYRPKIGKVSTRLWYETNPEMADLGTAQIGGQSALGRATVFGKFYYSWGNNDRPNHIEISARPDNDFIYGGSSLATFDADGFPVPTLTPAMFDRLGHVGDNLVRRGGQLTIQHSGQDKFGSMLDAQIALGESGWIKLGGKHVESWRSTDNTDFTNAIYTDGTKFSTLGLYTENWREVYPGKYGWSVPKIDQDALFKLFHARVTAASSDSCAIPALLGICNTQKGREAVSATYVMGNLQLDTLEIQPGLRFEHTEIKNVFWQDAYDKAGHWSSGSFASSRTVYDELLPSLFVNWRPNEAGSYRALIWTSYTKPAFVQLASAETITRNDSGTSILAGNPDLKPIKALNGDVSAQWSLADGTYIQTSFFAKALRNYLYNSGSTLVNPALGDETQRVQPQNGGDGHVYGLEIEFRREFPEFKGWLSGLGVGANFTRLWTQVDLGSNTALHHERIQNAPSGMANVQLFYERDGIQFDMLWHYSSAYVSRYDILHQNASWDHEWIQPMQRVDLHLGYALSNGLRVDGSISNLLDDFTYWSHVGQHTTTISDIAETGRTAILTFKYAL
ncbi:TonB-dependent receptor [Rhizomicrobium palustre]|uniref:TonB-dependent receptor n=1 Tax=Rhizomicrobium palustre TaxID=189966 RepID=A0A846MUT8_9PROT|nr:TonB-dependent receptor [Rhizomicrobium palustre]NIK87126.1 TonB-dependent receptor [Rhizomicrobium palustre]